MRSGVSQPTLTRAIQRLEQELGGTLIYRDGKDTRLTALGRDMRAEFSNIAESEHRVRALSQNRVQGRREKLHVGVVHTLAPSTITPFITHALRQMPMLEVLLHPLAREDVAMHLLSGRLDGCFGSEMSYRNAKLVVADLFAERLLLAMATDHPLANNPVVMLADFAQQPYLDRLHCEFRTRIIDHLGNRSIVMVPRLRSEREDIIQQAVAEGAGVCMLPEWSAIVSGLVLRPVEGLDIVRQVSFASVSGSGTAMALRQLRALLDNYDWTRLGAH